MSYPHAQLNLQVLVQLAMLKMAVDAASEEWEKKRAQERQLKRERAEKRACPQITQMGADIRFQKTDMVKGKAFFSVSRCLGASVPPCEFSLHFDYQNFLNAIEGKILYPYYFCND